MKPAIKCVSVSQLGARLSEIYRDIYVSPGDEARELAYKYGYLPYMVERYIRILGREGALELLEAFERPLMPVVRTNTLLIGPEALRERLEFLGFELRRIDWSPESFRVIKAPESPTIGSTHEYLKGYYYVHRDASSLLPVRLLLHGYKGDVLDACAAPGGKATFMSQVLKERGEGVVYANDLVLSRLKSLIGHVMRMGLDNVIVTWSDARKLSKLLNRKFERVLLDAPCSGEGRIMADPGRKHRTSIADLAVLVKREIELLGSLADLLEEGGVLAYSTCSIAPEENEYVVTKVLEARGDLEVIDPPVRLLNYSPWLEEFNGLKFHPDLRKCVRLWPHIHGTFGFTTCLLKKVS